MVAGLNIRVDHIELVGGKVDEVPRQLVDETGRLFNTAKAYYIDPTTAKELTDAAGGNVVLRDTQGKDYVIQPAGWVTPVNEPAESEEPTETTTPADSSAGEKKAKTSKRISEI